MDELINGKKIINGYQPRIAWDGLTETNLGLGRFEKRKGLKTWTNLYSLGRVKLEEDKMKVFNTLGPIYSLGRVKL